MPTLTRSVTANANGAGSVDFSDVPTGIQWIVWQTSVETLPQGTGCSAYIKLNRRLVTSSAFGSSSAASGPPAITISPGDSYTVEWVGAPAGSALIGTLMYDEVPYGHRPSVQIV